MDTYACTYTIYVLALTITHSNYNSWSNYVYYITFSLEFGRTGRPVRWRRQRGRQREECTNVMGYTHNILPFIEHNIFSSHFCYAAAAAAALSFSLSSLKWLNKLRWDGKRTDDVCTANQRKEMGKRNGKQRAESEWRKKEIGSEKWLLCRAAHTFSNLIKIKRAHAKR